VQDNVTKFKEFYMEVKGFGVGFIKRHRINMLVQCIKILLSFFSPLSHLYIWIPRRCPTAISVCNDYLILKFIIIIIIIQIRHARIDLSRNIYPYQKLKTKYISSRVYTSIDFYIFVFKRLYIILCRMPGWLADILNDKMCIKLTWVREGGFIKT
jgi:hypothetical protein